jgi:hypothetical protein
MQVGDLPLLINPLSPRINVRDIAVPESVPTPIATTPATEANLTPATTRASNVYDKPTVRITYLRDQNTTPNSATQVSVSKTLSSHLNSLLGNTEPFIAGLFFSQVGALSKETSRFANEARSVQVPGNVATEKFSPDFSRQVGKPLTSATLNIRTRDGDTISINLVRNSGKAGDSLSFSFEVEGDLSAAEQAALDKLANKLGEVADEFFRNGTAELRGLEAFDDKILGSFDITFSQFNGTDYDTFNYNYSIDETTNTAHLTGKDVHGYNFNISSHLTGLSDGKTAASHQSLEQYLALIREAGKDHDADSSSVRFMLDGLRSMILPRVESEASNDNFARMLGNFDTALHDFTATFSAPNARNPGRYAEVSAMNLSMGQITRAEVQGGRIVVQQESYYELRESHWDAIAGMEHASLDTGNYQYVSQFVKESTIRTLDTKDGQIKDLFVEHQKEWQRKEEAFYNFNSAGVNKSGDSDEKLLNLMDQLTESSADIQQHDLLHLLNRSRENLFNRW